MAPEYASQGVFSVKTDVFSFGVLLIEIISGMRSAGFHQQGDFFNLLGYVSIFYLFTVNMNFQFSLCCPWCLIFNHEWLV
jgi:hypothetical protein